MLWGEGVAGVGLPLLHALQRRPPRGADQRVGGDPEAGEVLEVEAVPQLGEQGGLLKQTDKGGVLRERPRSFLSSGPPPLGAPLPPGAL